MANAYANAAVLEKIKKPSPDFSPQEEHRNETKMATIKSIKPRKIRLITELEISQRVRV